MKNNILTLFVSIIFSIFLVELTFKFFYPQELNTPFFITGENGLVLNIKNEKGYHSYQNRSVKYKFGEFHNREYGFNKKKEKILVLGDSFTFGWLLKDKDTFVYKLNKKFKDYYFINSATGGWGTSDQLSYLIKFCKPIKPKNIIIIINNGDLVRAYNSNLFYLNDENELVSGKNEINKLNKLTENSFYKFLINNFHSIRFIKMIYVNFFVNYNDKDKLTMDSEDANNRLANDYILPKKLYLKIAEEVKKCNSNLILINLAWRNIEIDKNLIFYKENKNFFVNNDISYIDLNNGMKTVHNNKKNYEIKNDGHPNELANEHFYKIISNKLENILN
jgi:hypothetical protein